MTHTVDADAIEPAQPATVPAAVAAEREEAGNRSATDLAATGIRIVVWTLANLTFLLGAWVLLGWSVAGWSPVVVTSDSMRPTLDAGDVILIADDSTIGQRDVIVFERDDALIAHRVFAVEDGFFVTKGDANSSPDTDPVDEEAIVGTGRLVIPLVGLPVVWAQSGEWIPFAAWAVLTGAGMIGIALAVDRAVRKKRNRDVSSAVSVARIGIQRVRILTAVLILGQLVISSDGDLDITDSNTHLSLLAVLLLVVTNALPAVQARRGRLGERTVALFELVIDTTLVLLLATSTETGLTWILFALPIIEAAVRFRLAGALVHWMILTGVTITLAVGRSSERTSSET